MLDEKGRKYGELIVVSEIECLDAAALPKGARMSKGDGISFFIRVSHFLSYKYQEWTNNLGVKWQTSWVTHQLEKVLDLNSSVLTIVAVLPFSAENWWAFLSGEALTLVVPGLPSAPTHWFLVPYCALSWARTTLYRLNGQLDEGGDKVNNSNNIFYYYILLLLSLISLYYLPSNSLCVLKKKWGGGG